MWGNPRTTRACILRTVANRRAQPPFSRLRATNSGGVHSDGYGSRSATTKVLRTRGTTRPEPRGRSTAIPRLRIPATDPVSGRCQPRAGANLGESFVAGLPLTLTVEVIGARSAPPFCAPSSTQNADSVTLAGAAPHSSHRLRRARRRRLQHLTRARAFAPFGRPRSRRLAGGRGLRIAGSRFTPPRL